MKRNETLLLGGALLLLSVAPFFGSEFISPSVLGSASDSPQSQILWQLRIPRILFCIAVGGGLALLGGTYQILFRNPLAEPYILGVSSAVALSIVLAKVILGWHFGTLVASILGFGGAMAITALLVVLCLIKSGKEIERIILFGMALNFVLSSCLFLILSYHHQHLGGGSMRWLFGQMPWLNLNQSSIYLSLTLLLFAFLFLFSRKLDALTLGDTVARTLGVSPAKTRSLLLILTSAYLAVFIPQTGSIGFVGLVVPHVVRLIFRPSSTRLLFVYSLVMGAVFLVGSDIVSRVLFPPFEFPIGIVTTLLGGPLFLLLLWRRR